MKIQKGHYVPKELITSEAVHEAVVKAFVAAGFAKVGACDYGYDIGVGSIGVGKRFACGLIQNPLTLQQLFTAENGLQWPDYAVSIQANDTAVWFDDGNHPKEQFKVISTVKNHWNTGNSLTLSTRQPKEKEVKTIEDVVAEHCGKWPEEAKDVDSFVVVFKPMSGGREEITVFKSEFEACAKRLGYINGYRWGVEYPTNGKRPDLADDVDVVCFGYDGVNCGNGRVFERRWDLMEKFKITDQRYKPADTSYLKKVSEAERFGIMPPMNINERCDLNNWHERGELPPVGEHCEYKIGLSGDYSKCTFVGINSNKNFVIEVYGKYSSYHESQIIFRQILTEREKVIEAAVQAVESNNSTSESIYDTLYNAGMLVLPPKKSDTKY